jgi:hypothetical protein
MLWRSGLPHRREGASFPGLDPTTGFVPEEEVASIEEVRQEEASIRLCHASSHPISASPQSFVRKEKEEE